MKKWVVVPVAWAAMAGAQTAAQAPNPTQNTTQQVVNLDRVPVYRVTVVQRKTKAVNYRHRGGATKIDFRGTPLLPRATGEAKVESKQGYIEIEVEFDELSPATQFGPEYLTYVLWGITPEGRAVNLGEVLLNGNRSKLNVTTELQSFGMIVTAEPYFGVTQPSDVVVMENMIRRDTLGKVDEIDASYELLQRGQYTLNVDRAQVRPVDAALPLELREARNAVQIARWAGADKYASDSFIKAEQALRQAEDYHVRKQRKPVATAAREAVQQAEDARLISIKRIEAERQEAERRAAAEREAEAKRRAEEQRLRAEEETRRAADASRARQLAEEQQRLEAIKRAEAEAQQRLEAERRAQAEAQTKQLEAQAKVAQEAAERARVEAERLAKERVALEEASARASREKQEAEAARAAALAEQQRLSGEADRARQAASEAERLRLNAEQERENLRKQLLTQLNMILETRDSARGLIVNMSDVLFDTAKYTLRPAAREKLARVSGIVLAHPGLRLEIEGHTDSVGSDEYNQHLSEQRANAVREYLVTQGVQAANVTSKGLGETMPVASNDNAAGRQRNRRVELIVSGDVIGTKVSEMRSTIR
jgi:outer membrane protein OmpA-like peptidoglycan-associated protein